MTYTKMLLSQVPDSAVQYAMSIMNSTNPVPKTTKGDPDSPVKPTQNELQKGEEMYNERNDNNLK